MHNNHLSVPIIIYRVNWESDVQKGVWNKFESYGGNQSSPLSGNINTDPLSNGADSSTDVDHQRLKYVYVYSGTMCLVLYLVVQRGVTFFHMCLRASRRLHDKLFRGVIRATMYFFNTNSSGRIINRFSKDIGSIDTSLPLILYETMFVS